MSLAHIDANRSLWPGGGSVSIVSGMDDTALPRPRPSRRQLFLGFLEIASRSFGGAAAWARMVIVDRHRWLDDREFAESWSVAQLVPGPNVINLAVHLGDRARGLSGAAFAFAGIILVPTVWVLAIDAFLMHWIHIEPVRRALVGLGAGAAGLVWAMGFKMGTLLRGAWLPTAVAATAFVLAGPLSVPVPAIVLTLGPPSLLLSWSRR
jgi:chromate transporter